MPLSTRGGRDANTKDALVISQRTLKSAQIQQMSGRFIKKGVSKRDNNRQTCTAKKAMVVMLTGVQHHTFEEARKKYTVTLTVQCNLSFTKSPQCGCLLPSMVFFSCFGSEEAGPTVRGGTSLAKDITAYTWKWQDEDGNTSFGKILKVLCCFFLSLFSAWFRDATEPPGGLETMCLCVGFSQCKVSFRMKLGVTVVCSNVWSNVIGSTVCVRKCLCVCVSGNVIDLSVNVDNLRGSAGTGATEWMKLQGGKWPPPLFPPLSSLPLSL